MQLFIEKEINNETKDGFIASSITEGQYMRKRYAPVNELTKSLTGSDERRAR